MDSATMIGLGAIIVAIGVALLNNRTSVMVREQAVRIELVKCEQEKALALLRVEWRDREIERLNRLLDDAK